MRNVSVGLSLREVTRRVREMNQNFDGPCPVFLCIEPTEWAVRPYGYQPCLPATASRLEELPGDDRKIDAVAIARRLIATLGEGELPSGR
jgi:hypothetical protein